MKMRLIIIGNELLNGKIQDLNAHWFAQFCFEHNFDLLGVEIIKDSKEDFFSALDKATGDCDYIFTTGGLGPTDDDLTKTIMGEYFDKKIEFNQHALDITASQYQRGQRKFNPDKVKYPYIPKDFVALYNPTGYAPGLMYEFKKDKMIFATPGVPSEFQSMVSQTIFKHLKVSSIFQKHVIIKTWKLPEAKIFNQLDTSLWDKLKVFGEVSSLPHLLGVDIGVKIDSAEKEEKIIETVYNSPLKDYIWHIGPEKLEEVIISHAKEKNLKIGFAESCTGGLCASRLTDIAGSSSVFWGSIVSYSNEVKTNCLGVKEQTLKDHGAVSLNTAKEMAQGALTNMNLDIAIATTGIAGPGGGSEHKPVGTVGIGVATKDYATSEILNFKGSREQLKFRFSQAALYKLLETIITD